MAILSGVATLGGVYFLLLKCKFCVLMPFWDFMENWSKKLFFQGYFHENLLNSLFKSGHIKRGRGHIKRGFLCYKISGPSQNGHIKRVAILTGGHIKRGLLY